jgi:hypothetical protein
MGPQPNTAWGAAPDERPPATMPADFRYGPLPEPASDKPVALRLPIRVICGSEDAAGDFVPDPNMTSGQVNHSDSAVDTTVPHAAPLAVYQCERYGRDFTHCIPVPPGQRYLVRLHFAEIFDERAGKRVENIEINGQPVLKGFDIFAVAGGKDKAVVKEFRHIAPDPKGNIDVRVMSAPGSPDQNAKINGIEILEESGA